MAEVAHLKQLSSRNVQYVYHFDRHPLVRPLPTYPFRREDTTSYSIPSTDTPGGYNAVGFRRIVHRSHALFKNLSLGSAF